ncbi:MAG: PAS domain-containing sensor histidine kinase [Planctomycetes bacterium]|nr:PAS domain-containing sensor histidine kinase [Planctomycetota bacterium]
MVTIADLISDAACDEQVECDLVVSAEMSVRDVLARMEASHCRHVGIELEGDNGQVVLSKEDLLDSLLREVDRAGERLVDLQNHIDEEMSVQLDLVHENTRSMAELETNKLQVAIDYMTEGLVIIGTDGKINKCNPSAKKLFGLEGNESTDTFSDVFDDYGFMEMLTESVNHTVDNWGRFKMKSPSEAIIQIRWTEMVDECGDLIGNLVMLRDVTDELAGDRAKTEFIAAVTHELRTPVTIIQNSVSNILAGVTGKLNKKLHGYLETIQEDCRRFGVLVSDLLDMSKLEAGDMSLNRQVMDLGGAIEDALTHFNSDAKSKGVEIASFDVRYVPPVYADRERIHQVLFNLVENAVKFSESGDTVTVHCYEEDKAIVTVVEDTGAGIPEIHQKQLFNKFRQIGRQAGAGYKGMGLGLSICKGITEMHGGKIWAESQEGSGTKMFFSLPKIDPSIVLNKHLDILAKATETCGEEFALMVVRFDVDDSKLQQCSEVIGSSIKELLACSGNFLIGKRDLALEISDFEVVFAVSDARKKRVDTVKSKIEKVVKNIKKNMFNGAPIVPMIGIGVYPTDSNEIIEIENLARKTLTEI